MRKYDTSRPLPARWGRAVIFGLSLWGIMAMATLLWKADAVRHLPMGGSTPVGVGPFTLVQIAKTATSADGSFTLSFSMQGGIMLLGAVCLGLEIFIFVGLPAFIKYINRRRVVQGSKK